MKIACGFQGKSCRKLADDYAPVVGHRAARRTDQRMIGLADYAARQACRRHSQGIECWLLLGLLRDDRFILGKTTM